MAKQIECGKFKVIECTAKELTEAWGTSWCVCDFCNEIPLSTDTGYYIAVLNQWYCRKCFEKFKANSVWHKEDEYFEERHFATAKRLFKI